MTVRALAKRSRSLALASLAALAAILLLACGPQYTEIPIETPMQPKLDVSPFQRVLVAGFVAGGTEDMDVNIETVRLLRSQLRTKSSLKVIDADVMALLDIAQGQNKPAGGDAPAGRDTAAGTGTSPAGTTAPPAERSALPKNIKEEKDLEPYERLFANTAYWKTLGEEYQNPLIVTGTVLFTPKTSNSLVTRDQETFDSLGRRQVVPVRTYMERKGFVLQPKFVFIDGLNGTTIYSERYREEVLYNAQQTTPALSSYFELMDRLVPNFLSALSNQKIKGTRILLN